MILILKIKIKNERPRMDSIKRFPKKYRMTYKMNPRNESMGQLCSTAFLDQVSSSKGKVHINLVKVLKINLIFLTENQRSIFYVSKILENILKNHQKSNRSYMESWEKLRFNSTSSLDDPEKTKKPPPQATRSEKKRTKTKNKNKELSQSQKTKTKKTPPQATRSEKGQREKTNQKNKDLSQSQKTKTKTTKPQATRSEKGPRWSWEWIPTNGFPKITPDDHQEYKKWIPEMNQWATFL